MVTNRDRKSFGSRRKNFKSCSGDWHRWRFRVQAFRDSLRWGLPRVQIFMNDEPDLLTWDAKLLSYWFSRNPAVFQDYLVNFISNLRGGHCFVSSRTRDITGGKITTFKVGHPVFDGACFPNVSFRIAWISFEALPCRGKNWITARVSLSLLKSRASPDMLPFSLCNNKRLAIRHMNRPLFPTTLPIPPYGIGK